MKNTYIFWCFWNLYWETKQRKIEIFKRVLRILQFIYVVNLQEKEVEIKKNQEDLGFHWLSFSDKYW